MFDNIKGGIFVLKLNSKKRRGSYILKRKLISIVLMIMMILGVTGFCFAESKGRMNFSDVEIGSWYYNAVRFNYKNNFIKGYNENTFAPNDNLTRGMLVTILYRMENSPENNGVSGFSDVENNKWYSKSIKWAVDKEIVHGYGENKFGPNDNILRQDVAVILRNYAKSKGKEVENLAEINGFSDIAQISNYANSAMKWAISNKVITGNSNGTLAPKGLATRAEAAAMLQKYCLNVEGFKNEDNVVSEDEANYAIEKYMNLLSASELCGLLDYLNLNSEEIEGLDFGYKSATKFDDFKTEMLKIMSENLFNEFENNEYPIYSETEDGYVVSIMGGGSGYIYKFTETEKIGENKFHSIGIKSIDGEEDETTMEVSLYYTMKMSNGCFIIDSID